MQALSRTQEGQGSAEGCHGQGNLKQRSIPIPGALMSRIIRVPLGLS